MRIGLSWDLDRYGDAPAAWRAVLAEIEQADQLGFDSVWLGEGPEGVHDCASPTLFMTYVSQKTKSLQLRVAGRRVARAHPVRIAEEVAVLDTFSRGRAGIAFAAAARQGVPAGHVHEVIDFVASAWAADELRYRGEHVRFPAHTPDDAPEGASEPAFESERKLQWEWGPTPPDFLAVTPKPFNAEPPVYVEIEDDETLEWAAQSGISPMVGADLPGWQAVERLARYREVAEVAGRSRDEVEAVLERRLVLDAAGDDGTVGGSPRDLVLAIRELRARTFISHLVWRRAAATPADLDRFASEVKRLLQA